MDKIRVIHDVSGGTLTVWVGDPRAEVVCAETEEEVVLMKDAAGRVIGFELLHFVPPADGRPIEVEAVELRNGPSNGVG